MKFIHLGDLHLGKKFSGINLIEDQRDALNQIIEIAKKEQVKVFLISGDVFDKSVPPNEAYDLFNDFITELVKNDIYVYVIPGNHDASEKISYMSYLLKNNKVYVAEEFNGKTQVFDYYDDLGVVHIHLLPFIKPSNVTKFYPDIKIDSYDTACKVVLENSNINYNERNIILAHQFLKNASKSGSEEMIIGGLDDINSAYFEKFDYVALGHIHKMQNVGKNYIRYSGSLLKYSFDEAEYIKGPLIVELKEKGNLTYKQEPIKLLHDVKIFEGYYNDLMQNPATEDYVKVIIHDEDPLVDSRNDLQQIYLNMVSFVIENSKTKEEFDIETAVSLEKKSMFELFMDFYQMQNNNVAPNEEKQKYIKEVIDKIGASDNETE